MQQRADSDTRATPNQPHALRMPCEGIAFKDQRALVIYTGGVGAAFRVPTFDDGFGT